MLPCQRSHNRLFAIYGRYIGITQGSLLLMQLVHNLLQAYLMPTLELA